MSLIKTLAAMVTRRDETALDIIVTDGTLYPAMFLIHECCTVECDASGTPNSVHIVARGKDEEKKHYGLGPFLFVSPNGPQNQAACLGMSISAITQ